MANVDMQAFDKIIVLDFGSQYNQLITRRIREMGVYSELLSHKLTAQEIKQMNPKGIIFSGGPNSVYDEDAFKVDPAIFELGLPILGICYGMQLMAHDLGGKVESADNKEYGKADIEVVDKDAVMFKDLPTTQTVWMSHGDLVTEVPAGFTVSATSANCPIAAMANPAKKLYGLQFHTEVRHTEYGNDILRHFAFDVCGAQANWSMEDFIDMQVAKIRQTVGDQKVLLGLSGGVDSTLAVIVSSMAVKKMGLPSQNVVACTMPCFGTSSRTKSNAIVVAEQLGCEVRVIDISKAVYQHFDDIGHAHDDYSVAYENAQARERTQVLMDIANKVNGLDVGTEDLSEFVDGWCTYNGDHTSMYDVNLGLTKTQVRANVRYVADGTQDKVLKAALYDVLDCPVTPELLPIHDDMIEQKSEEAVGSYSLQDFFTHMIMIRGFSPEKTFRLAKQAYGKDFSDEELVRWLTSYCKRYFSQQFKRSCLMDGPAVEAFTVSPRSGFLIPSDAESALFLKDLEKLK